MSYFDTICPKCKEEMIFIGTNAKGQKIYSCPKCNKTKVVLIDIGDLD